MMNKPVAIIGLIYDAANRMTNVYADNAGNRGGNIQGIGFTSSNRRLVTNDAEGLKWYVWGGDSLMAEYSSAGWANPLSWKKSYVYAGDSLLSTYSDNNASGETLEFHHPDRLGTKLVTNHSNNALNYEQSTLPYGTALTAEDVGTSTTNRKFTSYQRSDVTKLDYAVNRSYSSAQGRFTQVDPIAMKATNPNNPQTLNMYSYVGNDPINRTDPTGLFWGAFKKFFKAVWKAIKFIAKIVAFIATNSIKILLYPAKLLFDFFGHIKEWKNRCDVPEYNGLSQKRQEELADRGVSPEQWNSLKNKQRLGYFNMVAAIAAVGLSLAGWVVDWDKDKGIQQDRVFFKQGVGATNLLSLVDSSKLISKFLSSYRLNTLRRSTEFTFSDEGRKLEVDIDIFNPNLTFRQGIIVGFLLHFFGEIIPHKVGSLYGGGSGKTNPYNVAYRSSWECR